MVENTEGGNFIFVKANFLKVRALIDTGAQKSCISETFCRKLHLKPDQPKVGNSRNFFTADGKPIRISGTVEISVKIQGLSVPFTFHVLRGLNHNLILGVDFLSTTNAKIDMSNCVISLCDDLVTTSLTKPGDCLLRTVAPIEIPGESEAIFSVEMSRFLNSKCAVVEPSPVVNNNFVVGRSVVKPVGKKAICKILNPTNTTIFLRKGDVVAKISEISNVNICEITEHEIKADKSCKTVDEIRHALDEKGLKFLARI